jgi:hypothetical protein
MQYTDRKTFTIKCWKDNIAIANRVADSLKAFGGSKEDGKGWKSMEGLCSVVAGFDTNLDGIIDS